MLTHMNLSQSKLAQMVPFKAQDDDLIVSATRSFRAAIHTNWVTAKVIENRRAKRFINRLDVLGFEYLIQHDNHDLRILVRSDQLEEALGWFEELARPVSRARENIGARSSAWLLQALPIGMLAGSIFSSLIGLDGSSSTAISAICGVMAAIAAVLRRG